MNEKKKKKKWWNIVEAESKTVSYHVLESLTVLQPNVCEVKIFLQFTCKAFDGYSKI